jgi:flavorubredoxin
MAEVAASQSKKALIVVDPGFSKFSARIAQTISEKLTQKGYTVKLVTANNFKVLEISGADLLVLGGPVYAGQPSGGIKKVVQSISNGNRFKTLLYVTGALEDSSGLEPLCKLVVEKGLNVIGSGKILVKNKEAIEPKINKLLESI